MIWSWLVTGKAGPEILDRTAVIMLIRTMAFNTGQLTNRGIWISTKARISMTVSTVACLGLCPCMMTILAVTVVTGYQGPALARINHVCISRVIMAGTTTQGRIIQMLGYHIGIMTGVAAC